MSPMEDSSSPAPSPAIEPSVGQSRPEGEPREPIRWRLPGGWGKALVGGGWLIGCLAVLYAGIATLQKVFVQTAAAAAAEGVKSALNDPESALSRATRELTTEIRTYQREIDALKKPLQQLNERTASVEAVVGVPTGRKKAVFVVLPKEGPGADTARDLFAGIRAQTAGDDFRVSVTAADGTIVSDIVYIVWITDHADTARTIRDIELESKYDCVFVLGHSDSTKAQKMCDSYYEEKGIPVILLGPTNPAITKGAVQRGRALFLRLLPTDGVQVEAIVKIVEAAPQYSRLLVYWDGDNVVYSDYIRAELERRLSSGDRSITSVLVSSVTARDRDYSDDVSRYDPQLVICVSLTATAKAVIEGWGSRLRSTAESSDPRSSIDLMLTDGCTSAEFCEFIRREKRWRRCVLLSPMPKPVVTNMRGLVDYKPLGVVAAALAHEILERALLNKLISRQTVAAQIHDFMIREGATIRIRENRSTEPISVPWELTRVDFRGSDLLGTANGDNRAWRYHYYGAKERDPSLGYLGDDPSAAAAFLREP